MSFQGATPGGRRQSPAPGSHRTQRADFPHWALQTLIHSMAIACVDCYSFESCCHDWRFFSLHRRPNPPFGWSSCFPRTIQLPLPASPCSRLSRPRSTIRQSDFRQAFGSSSLLQLVRPYKSGLSLTDLPCSHEILRLHASDTNPGSNSAHLP